MKQSSYGFQRLFIRAAENGGAWLGGSSPVWNVLTEVPALRSSWLQCVAVPALSATVLLGAGAVQTGAGTTAPNDSHSAATVRLWGDDGMASLVGRWEEGFRNAHPGVRFKNDLRGPDTAMAGLYNGVADMAVMGRELWPVDAMAFHWVYQYAPFGVEVATASLNSPGQSYTPVVFVNAANPLAQITLEQLDGIYGSEHRRGGKNLRVWGDLGLTGEWARRPIHVYGYGVDDAEGIYFRKRVLLGDYKPNVASHLLSDRDKREAASAQRGPTAADRIRAAVESDPLAIGYAQAPSAATSQPAPHEPPPPHEPPAPHEVSSRPERSATEGYASRRLKILPLAEKSADPPIAPAPATIADRTYPLTRAVSFYANRPPGKKLNPAVEEFLGYILSPAGQRQVAVDGHFTPLPPQVAAQQLQSLTEPQTEAPAKQETSSDN